MTAAAARKFRLISADGHLNEPADVWTSRVAAKFRARVPRGERLAEGDGWVFPGIETPIPFGWAAVAGRSPASQGPWCRYEDINPGSFDPIARVREMQEDGVDAELIFGSNYAHPYVAM